MFSYLMADWSLFTQFNLFEIVVPVVVVMVVEVVVKLEFKSIMVAVKLVM